MNLMDGICVLVLIWSIWKGYREGLFGVLFQWFGLFISLGMVWLIYQTAWWQSWGTLQPGSEGSWTKWGLLIGVLVGTQVVLMVFKSVVEAFFKSIGLGMAYRLAGAIFQGMKWVVIISLMVFLWAQMPGGSPAVKSALPVSGQWWLSVGRFIWEFGSNLF